MNMHIAAQINSFLASLVLLTAFGMLVQKRVYGLIHLFAWQGVFLSLNTAIVGYVVITLGSGAVILTRFGTRPKEAPATAEVPPIPDLPSTTGAIVTPLPFEPRRPDNPGTAPIS